MASKIEFFLFLFIAIKYSTINCDEEKKRTVYERCARQRWWRVPLNITTYINPLHDVISTVEKTVRRTGSGRRGIATRMGKKKTKEITSSQKAVFSPNR